MTSVVNTTGFNYCIEGQNVLIGETIEVSDAVAIQLCHSGWTLASGDSTGPYGLIRGSGITLRPTGLRGVIDEVEQLFHPIERYIDTIESLPAAPTHAFVYGANLDLPMCGNDKLGDCTFAGWYHGAQISAEIAQVKYGFSADQVGPTYTKYGNGADNGFMLSQILKWASVPGGLMDFEIIGAATIDITNDDLVKRCIYNFGWIYTALNLPESAETDFARRLPWRVSNPPGSPIGGHCVVDNGVDAVDSVPTEGLTGYDTVSWGDDIFMTTDFFKTYCTQAYVCLPKWYIDSGHDAIGDINVELWKQDMIEINNS